MSDEITARLAELVKQGRELVDGLESDDDAWIDDADVPLYESWLASVGNLILAIGGVESDHFVEYRKIVTSQLNPAGLKAYVIRRAFDVTLSVYEQWSQGAMRRIEDIVAATTLDGFLDQAARYHEAERTVESAALAGSVLGTALRRIASRNAIDAGQPSLQALVDDLVSAKVLAAADGKRIGTWAARQDRALQDGWNATDSGALIECTRELVEQHL